MTQITGNRLRRRTLMLTAIVVLPAMLLSFTLAWFAQLLASRDNSIASAGSDGAYVELWAQSAKGSAFSNGGFVEGISDATFHTAIPDNPADPDALAVVDGYLALTPDNTVPDNTLYRVVRAVSSKDKDTDDGLVYNGSGKTEWNRVLNDSGILPKQSITRRVIVRNTSEMPVSYTIQFQASIQDASVDPAVRYANDLGEAFSVTTTHVNAVDTDGNIKPTSVSRATNVDVNQLTKTTLAGELSGVKDGHSFAIYEMTFTFLGSASNFYEGLDFRLDAAVDARGMTAQIHKVSTAQELYDLLNPPNGALPSEKMNHGDTIMLMSNIIFNEDFYTDKLFNLELSGFQLTISGAFVINVAPDADGKDIFGTIDLAYKESQGKLIITSGEERIGIRAPKAAVRWNTEFTQPKDDTIDVRVFNGIAMRNKLAVMPITSFSQVGEEGTYDGLKWVVAHIASGVQTLLYQDMPLAKMQWNPNKDHTICVIDNMALQANIFNTTQKTTTGSLYLPKRTNIGIVGADAADVVVWDLFASNTNELRKKYISDYATADQDLPNASWTGTPQADYRYTYYIHAAGSVGYTYVDTFRGVVPAMDVTLPVAS